MAVAWQVELRVKPGQLDNFRTLTDEMSEVTKQEEGVLIYERFISADGQIVHVYERYVDSVAAVAHLQTFAKRFGYRFSSMVERQRFTVYGVPSAELKAILNGFGATYLSPFAGFAKQEQP